MAQSVVEISGHIIDSLLLPKVLDLIINLGAEFEILDIKIGNRRADHSYARIQIDAPTPCCWIASWQISRNTARFR